MEENNFQTYEMIDTLSASVDNYETIASAEIEDAYIDEVSSEDITVEIERIRAAMENNMFSSEETEIKKLSAASILIAKQEDVLPEEMHIEDGYDAASVADEAFVRTKTAYQVGLGSIDVVEQAEILMDRGAARLATIADKFVDKGVEYAINYADMILGKVYPPLKPVVDIVKTYQPFITESAKKLVRKGINIANQAAKKCLNKVVGFLKDKVKIFA